MNKDDLYTFVTSLLDGYSMDPTLFNTFLDIAQSYWEGQRPWVALRTEDASNTIPSSNTFETARNLPSDFRKWYTRYPIVLTDTLGNPVQYLLEIPVDKKSAWKSDNSRFYANYRQKAFYVCGSPAQSLVAHLFYIKRGTRMSLGTTDEEANITWELDPNDEYTKILGLSVAVYHKLGVDYDIINNSQANANAGLAAQIFAIMTDWDGELQESALQGQTYGANGTGYYGSDGMSGHLGNLG